MFVDCPDIQMPPPTSSRIEIRCHNSLAEAQHDIHMLIRAIPTYCNTFPLAHMCLTTEIALQSDSHLFFCPHFFVCAFGSDLINYLWPVIDFPAQYRGFFLTWHTVLAPTSLLPYTFLGGMVKVWPIKKGNGIINKV